jgi:hypothetical protein
MESVHSPVGGETLVQQTLARRLNDLNGKTIGESWNGDFKGDATFPMIRRRLLERFPGVRIIPYDQLPYRYGADDPVEQKALAREIALRAQALGCDAVISGNGA